MKSMASVNITRSCHRRRSELQARRFTILVWAHFVRNRIIRRWSLLFQRRQSN